VPGGVWRPCATPEGLQGLEVSGGPARPMRTSGNDLGCLEVSGGPARPLRASRLDMGCKVFKHRLSLAGAIASIGAQLRDGVNLGSRLVFQAVHHGLFRRAIPALERG